MTLESNDSERIEEEAEPFELTTESFSCPQCEASFDTEPDLALHRARVHLIEHKPASYACPVCSMEFLTQSQLDSHGMLEHPGP